MPESISHGSGCPICANRKRYTQEEAVEKAKNKGLLLLSEYVNAHTICKYICLKCGHKFPKTPHNVRRVAVSCTKCALKRRGFENFIYKALLQELPHLQQNKRGLLKSTRLELDIWDPLSRKAIELDGRPWHSSPKAVARDARKDKECKEAGIQLLRIKYEDEDAKAKFVKALSSARYFMIKPA